MVYLSVGRDHLSDIIASIASWRVNDECVSGYYDLDLTYISKEEKLYLSANQMCIHHYLHKQVSP